VASVHNDREQSAGTVWGSHFAEDVRVHPAVEVRGGLRCALQTVQSFEPGGDPAVSGDHGAGGFSDFDE